MSYTKRFIEDLQDVNDWNQQVNLDLIEQNEYFDIKSRAVYHFVTEIFPNSKIKVEVVPTNWKEFKILNIDGTQSSIPNVHAWFENEMPKNKNVNRHVFWDGLIPVFTMFKLENNESNP